MPTAPEYPLPPFSSWPWRGPQPAPETLGTGSERALELGFPPQIKKGVQISQGDQQWGPAPQGSIQFSPGWRCLLCLQAQLEEEHPLTAQPRRAPQKQDGEEGDSRGQGGQEQGSLYPARPRLMSPAGAANGKDKLAPALLVLGRAGDVPRDIPRSCRAQGWRRWAREHPYLSRLQGFLWDLLSNTELLCCSPFPASSRCPRSLLDAHTAQSCPLSSLPPRATRSRTPRASAPEPPGEPLARQDTGRPREAGLAPGTADLPSGDSGSFQSHEPVQGSAGSQEEQVHPSPGMHNRKSRTTLK